MNINISSLLKYMTLSISNQSLEAYYNSFIQILNKKNSNVISYISFHDYFNLCPFITTKIYNLFLHINNTKVLTSDSFINGITSLYLSYLEWKIRMIFEVCDFDNDGIILVEDLKLLSKHFHYSTNKTDVNIVLKTIEEFFGESKSMGFEEYEKRLKMHNSDIAFLFIFYLYNSKPFTENEINFYNQINFIKSAYSFELNSTIDNYIDVSEELFKYLNENYFDNEEDLKELQLLEEDFNHIMNDSHSLSTEISNNKVNNSFICSNSMKLITNLKIELPRIMSKHKSQRKVMRTEIKKMFLMVKISLLFVLLIRLVL